MRFSPSKHKIANQRRDQRLNPQSNYRTILSFKVKSDNRIKKKATYRRRRRLNTSLSGDDRSSSSINRIHAVVHTSHLHLPPIQIALPPDSSTSSPCFLTNLPPLTPRQNQLLASEIRVDSQKKKHKRLSDLI